MADNLCRAKSGVMLFSHKKDLKRSLKFVYYMNAKSRLGKSPYSFPKKLSKLPSFPIRWYNRRDSLVFYIAPLG